jgi:hypothetical protein
MQKRSQSFPLLLALVQILAPAHSQIHFVLNFIFPKIGEE